jgi:transcriptional regulator with XRE-family HTH domain
MSERMRVTSGISQLDFYLEGLFIGDNVVWYDDAGSLASIFCLQFIQASEQQQRPILYITFDRSPRNLIEKLGPLARYPALTILDCFTFGKGAGSSVFLKFYEEQQPVGPGSVVKVEDPRQINQVMESLYALHATLEGDVRLVFESLTGMAELWGGEEPVLNFYSHSCPRLYELNTVAYWIMEKKAHSPRFRAQINQIAQVAIDLSIKRGTTSLTILKAEKRQLDHLQKPYHYWVKEGELTFSTEKRSGKSIDFGPRLKEMRTKRGISQTELAQLVGVTPSTISQIESNMIYPSLPGLLKMAEILSVQASSFFREKEEAKAAPVFSIKEAIPVKLPQLPEDIIQAALLTPMDFEAKVEPYLIEMAPDKHIQTHFFNHKGEEMGYLISGELQVKLESGIYSLRPGEVIYLRSEIPLEWKTMSPDVARLIWLKIK